MDKNITKKVKAFLHDFELGKVTLEGLRTAIQKQGYTIIEYNGIADDANVSSLLQILELEQLAKSSKGFTYADAKRRLVFLHKGLSDEEQLMVLAHEEGHIYCDHFSSAPIIGKDVVEEHEANEFAHYLLHQSFGQKISQYISQHKKGVIAIACVVLLLIIGCLVYQYIAREQSYYGEYYITTTGNKYHEKDCIFVKDKNNTERLTKEQFEAGEYSPCAICLPE